MASRDDCIDEILKAAGGRRSRGEAEAILDGIQDSAEGFQRDGMAARAAYERARDEKLDALMKQGAIARRAARMDAGKSRDLMGWARAVKDMDFGDDWAIRAGESPLVGINHPGFDKESRIGNQRSSAAIGLGALNRFMIGIEHDLRAIEKSDSKYSGLYDDFVSKVRQRNIVLEKWELDGGKSGHPGITKDERALAIAKVQSKYDRARIDLINGEGAWIEDLRNHAFASSSDPDKMRKAGGVGWFDKGFNLKTKAVWVEHAFDAWDTTRMFGALPAQETKDILAGMYNGMVRGDHLEFAQVETGEIMPNLAAKESAHRVAIYKSAEKMLEYNEKYGRFDPTDTWVNSLRQSSRNYGLMRVFGTRPKEGFANYMAFLKNETMGSQAGVILESWDAALKNRYAFLSGEANRPVYGPWRSISNGIMSVQRLSKLGLTPFAMLQDNTTISRELSRQGASYWEANGSMITDYFQGDIGSAKRDIADLAHASLLADLHFNAGRFDVGDATAGALARAEKYFFKYSGISAMTENKRQNAIRMMVRHWGMQEGKEFASLGEAETKMLQAYGVGDAEWKLLNTAPWHEAEGAKYLTPDIADTLSDAAVESYLTERGVRADRLEGESKLELLNRTRQDLAISLHSYLADRGNYAVLEVGDKERAMLYGGNDPSWRPGTLKGEAWRMLMQFKQFPTAMVTRGWLADIQGLSGQKRLTGITELIVSSTLFGMAANYLNQVAKFQDPNSQYRNQPAQAIIAGFMRGGSGSIYGDFLFGEFSRFGRTAADTALGPALGQINTVAELWTDLTHPSKWKSGALGTAAIFARGNLPFMNMILTKSAFDYLIYYRMMEYISPGYLERTERNLKEKQGIEFMLRPTQVAR